MPYIYLQKEATRLINNGSKHPRTLGSLRACVAPLARTTRVTVLKKVIFSKG